MANGNLSNSIGTFTQGKIGSKRNGLPLYDRIYVGLVKFLGLSELSILYPSMKILKIKWRSKSVKHTQRNFIR